MLQSASVIGRVFRRRLLAHVTRQEADLDRALWELEERALIYEGRVTPEPEYSFQHQLTQETVYRSLLRRHAPGVPPARWPRRSRCCTPTAWTSCTSSLPTTSTGPARRRRRSTIWSRPGRRRPARFANAEAITHFDRALELAGERPDGGVDPVAAARASTSSCSTAPRPPTDYPVAARSSRPARADRRPSWRRCSAWAGAYYLRGLDDQTGDCHGAGGEQACERALALGTELGRPARDRAGAAADGLVHRCLARVRRAGRHARRTKRCGWRRRSATRGCSLEARMAVRRFAPAGPGGGRGEALARARGARRPGRR